MDLFCTVCGLQFPIETSGQVGWTGLYDINSPFVESATLCPEHTKLILIYVNSAAAAFKK
jgi:hypothetical protein